MKFLAQAIFLLIACVVSISAQQKSLPRFENYEAPLYQGRTHLPKWISRVNDDEWRDDVGKLVDPPEIGFAGKYFIAIHSCGTACGSYTMIDLSSGRELTALDEFAFAEPSSKTRDGHEYTIGLFYRPKSKMLVAQYNVELKPGKYECRERVFLFEAGKMKPLTNTKRECQRFEESN